MICAALCICRWNSDFHPAERLSADRSEASANRGRLFKMAGDYKYWPRKRITTVPNGVWGGVVAVLTLEGGGSVQIAQKSRWYHQARAIPHSEEVIHVATDHKETSQRQVPLHTFESKSPSETRKLSTAQTGGGRLEAWKEIKGGARLRGGAVLPCPASLHYPGMWSRWCPISLYCPQGCPRKGFYHLLTLFGQ